MRPRFKTALLPFLAAAGMTAFNGPAHAGAWLQPKGKGLMILSATMLSSDRAFDGEDLVDIPRYNKFELGVWLEYGLTDHVTLIFRPQLRSVEIADPIDASHTGAGYTVLGTRVGLWSDAASVFSFQSLVRIPGSRDEDDLAQTGSTDMETDLRVLYGHSFMLGAWPAFIDTEFAYRIRSGDAPDEIHSDVTFGLRPRPDIMLLAQFFNTFSHGKARGLYDTGREHKAALSVVWDFVPDWSLQVGGVATVEGENALRERGGFAAIWKRF